jgi:hypothetical protein
MLENLLYLSVGAVLGALASPSHTFRHKFRIITDFHMGRC